MRPLTENRLRWMAGICSHSTAPKRKCECRCGGSLHGQEHSEVWIAEVLLHERVRAQIDPDQVDWIGFEEFRAYL